MSASAADSAEADVIDLPRTCASSSDHGVPARLLHGFASLRGASAVLLRILQKRRR